MLTMFRNARGESARLAVVSGWPVDRVIAALRERYADLSDLGEEGAFRIYGVDDRGVRFAIVLVAAPEDAERVAEAGFIARFTGYALSDSALAAINRNLHLSLITYDPSGDIFLIGGVQADGDFRSDAFSGVLDSWRRDLLIALQGLEGGSIVDHFSAGALSLVRAFSNNVARQADGAAGEGEALLSRFMGVRAARPTVCRACGGRGKTGLMARRCTQCEGHGVR